MSFNFTTLSTTAACDVMLSEADREKTALQNRKNSLEFQIQNDSSESGMANDLADAIAELAAFDIAVASLPEGTVRAEMEIDRIEVNLRRARLQLRVDNADAYVEVNRQFNLTQLLARIAAIEEYLVHLTAYRAELPAEGAAAA